VFDALRANTVEAVIEFSLEDVMVGSWGFVLLRLRWWRPPADLEMLGGAVESAVSSRLCPSTRLGADVDTHVVCDGNMGPGSIEDCRLWPFTSAVAGPGDRRGT
jgi:hypothetical protein